MPPKQQKQNKKKNNVTPSSSSPPSSLSLPVLPPLPSPFQLIADALYACLCGTTTPLASASSSSVAMAVLPRDLVGVIFGYIRGSGHSRVILAHGPLHMLTISIQLPPILPSTPTTTTTTTTTTMTTSAAAATVATAAVAVAEHWLLLGQQQAATTAQLENDATNNGSDGDGDGDEDYQQLSDAWRYDMDGSGAMGVIDHNLYWTNGAQRQLSRYHIDDGEATYGLAMMRERHDLPAYGVHREQLFVASGFGSTTVEKYDPVIDTWSRQPSLLHDHYQGAMVTLNSRIMVAGGLVGASKFVRTCEAYDPRCDTKWQPLNKMVYHRHRFNMVALTSHTCVIVGGNRDETDKKDRHGSVLEYDARNDKWMASSVYPSLPLMIDTWSLGRCYLIDHTLVFHTSWYRSQTDFGYYLPLHPTTLLPLSSNSNGSSSSGWLPIQPPVGMQRSYYANQFVSTSVAF